MLDLFHTFLTFAEVISLVTWLFLRGGGYGAIRATAC